MYEAVSSNHQRRHHMPVLHDQEEMLEKMKDILGDDFTTLKISSYRLEEDFETDTARIQCKLVQSPSPTPVLEIEGKGNGIVDACFHALMNALASEYSSLTTIQFKDFRVEGLMSTSRDTSGSDAQARVTLTVLSSDGYEFTFGATSLSTSRAAIIATLQAVEYFINSEKSFVQIYRCLEHYRSENRSDLVTKYQLLLGQMVQNTSYSEVIEQIKAKALTH